MVATADGRVLHVSRSIRPLAAAGAAAATHALVLLLDRSVERAAENDRELLLGELRCTLEATADGILVTDLNGRVRAFNQRFAEMWAMPLALLQARDDAGVMDWMTRSVVDAKGYEHRLQALREAALVTACDRIELHSGQVLDRVTRPLFQGGSPRGRVYSFRDLTERIAAQERIEALAHTDALTGLANRARLAACVTDAAAAVRREGGGFALLVVDLDRFRHINDSLGHDTGDRVLIDVARRIQGCLRQGDTLARLGSDQFALLLGGADAAAAEATARRVLNVVAQPFSNDGAAFTLTCSIGMALAPSHGSGVDELARHADAAMRAVKTAGRANFRLHQMRGEVDRRESHAAGPRHAPGPGEQPLPAALPAAGAAGRRLHRRRRGAAALARPRAGRDVAGALHSGGRGQRLHRRGGRLGADAGGAPGRAVAPARAGPAGGGQRVGAAVQAIELRRPCGQRAGRQRPAAAAAGAGADRVDPGARRRRDAAAPARAGGTGRCGWRSTTSVPAIRAWPT